MIKQKYHPAFFFRYRRKETCTLRFIALDISKKTHQKQKYMKSQFEKYTTDELAERSADFEHLIDLLIDYTHIPKNLRNCTTEKTKLAKLAKEIYEIIRVNKKPYQNNIVEQNLFDL